MVLLADAQVARSGSRTAEPSTSEHARDGPYRREYCGTSTTIEIHINKAQASGPGAPRAGINRDRMIAVSRRTSTRSRSG
jgi:hypothetical protein